jgi:signal transduction histidine kinase
LREWLLDQTDTGRVEEVPLVRSDGSVATVEISSKVVPSGERTVRLCIVRNTTERKLMQREIRRVTQFAERILENMTNGLITVDADGLVTSCNKAMTHVLEPGSDPLGRQLDEVLRTQGQLLGKLVQSAIASGATQRQNVVFLSHGNSPVSASVTVSLLRDEQAATGAILVFTDTSQESKAREEWQRLAMLSALGQMSGVLAHDIRNRVTGVHVGVQYLAEKFPPDDPRRQSMEFIRSETERVVQIIDDILMLIRPGRTDRTPYRIGDVVERVVRAQAAAAQQRRIDVLAIVAPDLLSVSADSVQLERALSNLVKNAIEAMPGGGQVRISADMVSRDADGRRSPMVRLRVTDNGPGIPASVRTRLFQPFASEKKGGTGLGLSIAKRVIDEHGGQIEVETHDGQGTTFTVWLPATGERGIR